MITSSLGRNESKAAVFLVHGKSPGPYYLPVSDPSNPYRAVKRAKAYNNLEDVRPTLRNKPSGLKSDWHRTVSGSSRSSTPHRQVLANHAHSSSSSTLASPVAARSSSSSMSASPMIPESPSPEFDHASSLLAMTPLPVIAKSSKPLFFGDLVPFIDEQAMEHKGHAHPNAVCIFFYHCLHSGTHSILPSPSLYLVRTRTTMAERNNLG